MMCTAKMILARIVRMGWRDVANSLQQLASRELAAALMD
jgi:hypothetical protein